MADQRLRRRRQRLRTKNLALYEREQHAGKLDQHKRDNARLQDHIERYFTLIDCERLIAYQGDSGIEEMQNVGRGNCPCDSRNLARP